MRKKKKFIIIGVVVIVVVLAAGIVGGIVYAQSGSNSSDSTPPQTLMGKVAAILGIDQTKLEGAFAQAEKEIQSDNLNSYLKSLVDAGKITQEQADQYLQWYNSKPDIGQGFPLPGFGPGGHMGFDGPRGMSCFPPAPNPGTAQQ